MQRASQSISEILFSQKPETWRRMARRKGDHKIIDRRGNSMLRRPETVPNVRRESLQFHVSHSFLSSPSPFFSLLRIFIFLLVLMASSFCVTQLIPHPVTDFCQPTHIDCVHPASFPPANPTQRDTSHTPIAVCVCDTRFLSLPVS